MDKAARQAELILEIVETIDTDIGPLSLAQFLADPKMQEVLAFRFLRIGEAAKDMPVDDKAAHAEIPWASIVGLRNLIAHDYESVELHRVFAYARNNLGPLAAACHAILARHGETF